MRLPGTAKPKTRTLRQPAPPPPEAERTVWRFAALADAAQRDDGLLDVVQCPHCWHRFPPEDIRWVAASDALRGDPVLGEDAYLRFPPSRFTLSGHAIDGKGATCRHLACPRCHLIVPRDLLTVKPSFISIVGAAGSGKSYLLASMTHTLRRHLPERFAVAFNDADAVSNATLGEYENLLFHTDPSVPFVALRKTETHGGDLYNQARIGEEWFSFPRPFLFSLRPLPRHAFSKDTREHATTLVLYDNAGESFNPGADLAGAPVTHHVAHSTATLFLFDPTKDADFRRHIHHADPQLRNIDDIHRQSVMVNEMANRVKTLLGLHGHQRHDRTLIVAVSKFDVWRDLLPHAPAEAPFVRDEATGLRLLDTVEIDNVSLAVRELLRRLTPELVAAAESGWKTVRYIPVSATGCSPVENAETGALGFRPADLAPLWADVPMLYILARHGDGLVGISRAGGNDPIPPADARRAHGMFLVDVPGFDDPLEVPEDYAGQPVRCPRTGQRFRLPE